MVSTNTANKLHLVVTCSNRKRQAVPEQLRLASLPERRSDRRFAMWTERLSHTDGPRTTAVDLYAGEHWQLARRLPTCVGSATAVSLWICSAGYGLLSADTPILPYAATFALGGPDSAGGSPAGVRGWWRRLGQWREPAPGQPRSFQELARRDRGATIVAVLSEAYQRACVDDLIAAAGLLESANQLAVIGGKRSNGGLGEIAVPVTARLQPLVGGSLLALNVRVARYLLQAASEAGDFRAPVLRRFAREAEKSAPERTGVRSSGQRLTDDDVRSFIRGELATGPGTATGLLRRLRRSDRSCEQARFGRLFAEVAAGAGN